MPDKVVALAVFHAGPEFALPFVAEDVEFERPGEPDGADVVPPGAVALLLVFEFDFVPPMDAPECRLEVPAGGVVAGPDEPAGADEDRPVEPAGGADAPDREVAPDILKPPEAEPADPEDAGTEPEP